MSAEIKTGSEAPQCPVCSRPIAGAASERGRWREDLPLEPPARWAIPCGCALTGEQFAAAYKALRPPWRFDVPEVPANVTAIKIGRGDRWGRIDANRWGRLWEDPSSGKWCITDARMSTAQLFGCGQSLVECEDPRATS